MKKKERKFKELWLSSLMAGKALFPSLKHTQHKMTFLSINLDLTLVARSFEALSRDCQLHQCRCCFSIDLFVSLLLSWLSAFFLLPTLQGADNFDTKFNKFFSFNGKFIIENCFFSFSRKCFSHQHSSNDRENSFLDNYH